MAIPASSLSRSAPPPPPPSLLTAGRTLPVPVQSIAAQAYQSTWRPLGVQTQVPVTQRSGSDGGISGFLSGIGEAGSNLIHAGTETLAGTAGAVTQIGQQVVRSGVDVVASTASAGIGAVTQRVESAASIVSTATRGALDTVGSVFSGTAAVAGSVVRGSVDVGSHLLDGPAGLTSAIVRSGAGVIAQVAESGGGVAATIARAGGSIAETSVTAIADIATSDARGLAAVASRFGDAASGIANAAGRAGSTLRDHALSAADHLVDAGTGLAQTYARAAEDVTSFGLRVGGAVVDTAQRIGEALTRPFDTSHHANGPVTAPGGLGTQVGGVGTPQEVYRNALLAGESYTNRAPDAQGNPPVGLPPLPDGSRAVTDPGELAKLGLNPSMLSDPAVPGYQAQVYATRQPDGGTRYTVGFAGTDDVSDIVTDARQAFGQDTGSYAKALEIGRAVATHPGVDVEFVGHSLGGGLAAEAAIASGRHADTFNAAGIHQTSLDRALDVARAAGVAPGTVDNYRVEGEVLTALQEVPALRGAVGGVLGIAAGGGGGLVFGGIPGAIGGTIAGVPGGVLFGANLDIPAAYGRQHDTPFVPIEGRSSNIGNRHTMDFVLASIRSQLN